MARSWPIGRLVAEGVVVVGSILLAFAIDAWWDRRGELEQEQRLLGAVLLELRANEQLLASNTASHRAMADRAERLLEFAAGREFTVSPDSVDHLLAGLSAWTIPVYERGALDAAVTAGGLAVLERPEVTRRLSEWQLALDRAADVEFEEEYYARDVWMPLLRSLAYLPQIWNVGAAKVPGWITSPTPTGASQDHRSLLRNREFVNLLLERKVTHEDILDLHSSLQAQLAQLTGFLEEEVGSQWGAS